MNVGSSVFRVTTALGIPGTKLRPRPDRPRCAVRREAHAATLLGAASVATPPTVERDASPARPVALLRSIARTAEAAQSCDRRGASDVVTQLATFVARFVRPRPVIAPEASK